jgi:hypothetical protein
LQNESQLLCGLTLLVKDRFTFLVFVVLALEADSSVVQTFTVTELEQTCQVVCLFGGASIVYESFRSALNDQLFALLNFGHLFVSFDAISIARSCNKSYKFGSPLKKKFAATMNNIKSITSFMCSSP